MYRCILNSNNFNLYFEQALAGSVRECLHTSQATHQATLQHLGPWSFTGSFIM